MTFSMATDRYPAMHQPWGHWPSLHMQGAYMPHHWQGSMPSGGSCMYSMSDYRAEKPPLTQLQELTSVFPSPEDIQPNLSSHHNLTGTRRDTPSYMANLPFRPKDPFADRECDSGYAPEPVRADKFCEREPDAGYSSDRPSLDPECDNSFISEPSAPRECDSGFGPASSGKEEPDTFSELCGECDSGFVQEGPSENTGPRDALADSDSGCADLTGKWEEETLCALPGFQQAFGSTEIGRFSRNDFFMNPSPPPTIAPACETVRKTVRKPRSPRVKQVRKERPDSPKLRSIETRGEGGLSNVPMSDAVQCNSRVCGPQYEACAPRYCPEYSPQPSAPPSCYPYSRSSAAPYSSYPHPDLPYFRPFPFPLTCGQTWPEPRWPQYQPQYQQPYQQPYQPQQPWTSANVYPFMRLDY